VAQGQRTGRNGLEENKSINIAFYLFNSMAGLPKMLLVLVCDQKSTNFFVLCGRIHGRTHGYKWSLLKVREEKYKGKHGWPQVEIGSLESMFLLFRCF
jgi:hypothetical protein